MSVSSVCVKLRAGCVGGEGGGVVCWVCGRRGGGLGGFGAWFGDIARVTHALSAVGTRSAPGEVHSLLLLCVRQCSRKALSMSCVQSRGLGAGRDVDLER
uniref:Uncharacterized protein n=1 Tax=Knipowitschia caucasica TaxID=637954 RepID=A0AAV2LHJ5_KNICA